MFQTPVHPTDFDEPSKEAFRVARSLAGALGARIVVFHVVSPPAIVTHDGKVIRDPHNAEPVDLWEEYRALQVDGPKATVEYAVVAGDMFECRRLLQDKIRQLNEMGDEVLVVMGSHGRRGIKRLLWGSKAEEVVRQCICPVLVVKAPSAKKSPDRPEAIATASAEDA